MRARLRWISTTSLTTDSTRWRQISLLLKGGINLPSQKHSAPATRSVTTANRRQEGQEFLILWGACLFTGPTKQPATGCLANTTRPNGNQAVLAELPGWSKGWGRCQSSLWEKETWSCMLGRRVGAGAQLAQPGDSPDVIAVDSGDEHLPLVIIDE